MNLNSRQIAFSHAVAGGKSLVDAYCEAFPKANRDSARSAAARLMKQEGVSEEINRLRDEVRQSTILSFQQKREFLAGVIQQTPSDAPKVSDQIRAVEIDNKMSGDNFADRDQSKSNPFLFIVNLSKNLQYLNQASNDQKPVLEMVAL
jgi:hypothetical protein